MDCRSTLTAKVKYSACGGTSSKSCPTATVTRYSWPDVSGSLGVNMSV